MSSHGVRISYAVQAVPGGRTKPLGTADALLCALRVRTDWSGKKFTVCNGDNLYSQGVLKQLRETGHPGALIDYDGTRSGSRNRKSSSLRFLKRTGTAT